MRMPAEAGYPAVAGWRDAAVLEGNVPEKRRHRTAVQTLRRFTVVHVRIGIADFVFHLNGQNRVHLTVSVAQKLHQACKGTQIGFSRFLCKRRQRGDIPAVRPFGQRETARVRLHPFRAVGRMTVLVDAEPQQDEMDIFVPAQFNQFQRLGEIIFSLAFFHLNPVHRSL